MFNGTALNAYVKRRYDPKAIYNEMLSVEDKCFSDIRRETDGSGENYSWLTDADDDFNGSPDFPTAQNSSNNNNNAVGSKFLSDWNDWSAVAAITSSIIGKTRNNDGAWMKAVDVAMRKRVKAIAHANAVQLQGQGWGEVSDITTVVGSTFVPKTPSDITKYVKGMPLHFASTLNASTLRSATVLYVTGVSYTVGAELVTLSATLASVGAVANDFAFFAGARQDSATPARIVMTGLGAWFPNQNNAIDASNSTLFTVNRTTNSRLYGTFQNGTTGSAVGALMDGAQEAITIGNAKKLRCYCSKNVYKDIAKDLQTAVQYHDNPGSKTVGTRRLTFLSNGDAEATLEVSRTTNDNQIWGYDPEQVIMRSIGGAPHIETEDGLTMARQATAAAWEIRWFQQAIYEFINAPGGLRVQLV